MSKKKVSKKHHAPKKQVEGTEPELDENGVPLELEQGLEQELEHGSEAPETGHDYEVGEVDEEEAKLQKTGKVADPEEKVKMKFSEPKYYTDLDAPLFVPGKVYELEGADWIQRWVKRGGEIVTDENAEDDGEPSIASTEPQGGGLADNLDKTDDSLSSEQNQDDSALGLDEK